MKINNILVVGDSLSRGVVYDETRCRYRFLKDCFVSAVAKLIPQKIMNESKFGATIGWGKQILLDKMEQSDADLVLIEFGGNDCDFDWDAIALSPDKDHQPKTLLPEYEETLTWMVRTIRERGKKPALMTLPPLNAPAYFQWFTGGDVDKGREILKWLGDVTTIYWWHERYSSAISRVANKLEVPLVDVRGSFLAQPNYREYICLDGIHPNERGHQLITDAILDTLLSYPGEFATA